MTVGFRKRPGALPIIDKGPNERLDYPLDWNDAPPNGPWLAAGEYLTGTPVITAPAGITVDAPTLYPSVQPTMVIVWASGGVIGTTYTISVKITTNMGRVAERSFQVAVVMR